MEINPLQVDSPGKEIEIPGAPPGPRPVPIAKEALKYLQSSILHSQIIPSNNEIRAQCKIVIYQEVQRIRNYSERYRDARSVFLSPEMRRWLVSVVALLNQEEESEAAVDALRGMSSDDLQSAVKVLLASVRGTGRKSIAKLSGGGPD